MPDDRTVDFVVMFLVFGMVGLGLLSMAVGWVVNLFRGDVTSSNPSPPPDYAPSSLQTDDRRTPDRPMIPLPSRDVMLDTYRTLRKLGMAREEARMMLRALGLPLDNNLWTQAAPPPPEHVTPIAGRPTAAQFPDDELEYQPLR
jgi:hypothetical protein